MTDAVKAALAELFATIVNFVTLIFNAEVGTMEEIFDKITK